LIVVGGLLGAVPLAAQTTGDLPDQLRVIGDVRFKGMKHLGKRQLKEARLKTRDPSRLPWHDGPRCAWTTRADTAAITASTGTRLPRRAHWDIQPTGIEAARVVFIVEGKAGENLE
jgi:hypothetical protein